MRASTPAATSRAPGAKRRDTTNALSTGHQPISVENEADDGFEARATTINQGSSSPASLSIALRPLPGSARPSRCALPWRRARAGVSRRETPCLARSLTMQDDSDRCTAAGGGFWQSTYGAARRSRRRVSQPKMRCLARGPTMRDGWPIAVDASAVDEGLRVGDEIVEVEVEALHEERREEIQRVTARWADRKRGRGWEAFNLA